MPKKTWKIGERGRGGIIQAETNGVMIIVRCKDYFTGELIFQDMSERQDYIENVLLDWTSSYYAEVIMDWISSKQIKVESWY